MRKILSSIILLLALVSSAYAQDARQRTVETVVADVLAAMPANSAADFDAQMSDLALSAPSSVTQIAVMLKPAADGVRNSLYEYALTGLADYASSHPECADKVREGFRRAFDASSDNEVSAFLLNQYRKIARPAEAEMFKDYVNNPALAATAIGAIVDVPGTENLILDLVKDGTADHRLLAAAAAEKGVTAAEPYIRKWAVPAELNSTPHDNAIFSSLAALGTESSLDILKENSTADYAALAVRLADGQKSKAVAKAAKTLMSSEVSAYKSAGALAQMKNDPSKAAKLLASALKSDDTQYRNSVMDNATSILGAEEIVPVLDKAFEKGGSAVRIDILNWFGNNKIDSAMDLILGSFSEGGEVSAAAIAAAGKIGGDKAAEALVGQLGGENSAAAETALKSFRGDWQEGLLAALDNAKDTQTISSILSLVGAKKIKAAAPKVYSLIGSGDATVSALARNVLADVVGVQDIDKVGALLDKSSAKDEAAYQNALVSAIHTLSPAEQYSKVSALINKSTNAAAYYPVLASTGTDEAAAALAADYEAGSADAAAALLKIDNFKAAPVLLKIAGSGSDLSEAALKKYTSLVSQYETDRDRKRMDYAEALEIAGSASAKKSILKSLSAVPTMKAFLLGGKYLDDNDKSVRYAAADCVKSIAAKTTEEINYADLKSCLDKAVECYREAGGADDGYAVDEIGKILSEAEPSPVSQLTEEERKQGFEMLFDGTDLDKWQGDFEGYTPVNGTIYVSANYGSTGNLYTKKEYRNFVFRFEFCFLREGVNNGVGVRTPMGVDAAYDAMCEVQILDHDAPMYANLREYQVHGSVYGVIPAKRIVHKPLGEWSTEEIRVEGDHIKVTVNGEVIVDGNIRKACKGHNVAPDGSKKNPYTVDHRNHPGMFNEKGYISFCGHGEGLKLRNVRILDLGDKK